MAGETWDYPPEPPPTGGPSVCPTNYTLTYAREFQYDGPRQRYLNEEYDPSDVMSGAFTALTKTWSYYDGDSVYLDRDILGDNTRSYQPGMGTFAWSGGVPDTASAQYYHTNMIGTTRMMTDATGAGVAQAAYTAFGEQRDGSPRRYGYAGAHGYQTATGSTPGDAYETGFTFQHLGHRYYDPASGRFLQRDPIGIRGGLNVYAYVLNRPTAGVDPTGKGFWGSVWSGVKIVGGAIGGIVGGRLIVAGMAATAPAWLLPVGVVVSVVGVVIAVSEIVDILDTADKVIDPIRKPVKRRNRAVDNAIDCVGLGMEDD